MRNVPPRRHVLVVAPQCRSMEKLDRLEEAATDLYDVLADDDLGACRPGLPDDRSSLVTGHNLTSHEIRALIEDAIEHAAKRNASLFLALLGHGFVPGTTTTLYLMGSDSREDRTERAVNVGELLAGAANHGAIPSVLGIIDTCHAAGASPPREDLAAGMRNGRSRLSLLMGSLAGEEGSGLTFSRELARVIRKGVPGSGALLGLREVRQSVRGLVVGQNVSSWEHDGDGLARGWLWITRNASHHHVFPGGLCGPLAREELTAALGALDPEASATALPSDAQSALECQERLKDFPDSVARRRAERAVRSLLIAVHTVKFIRSWLGSDLTTARLRRALHTQLAWERRLPSSVLELSEVEAVDRLAFDHPRADPDCRHSVARFVALLAQDARKDFHDEALARWALLIDAQRALNDAVEDVTGRQRVRRLKLAVSLHSSLTGDWPEEVGAWLLKDGGLLHREDFRCPTVDRNGTESAVMAAVRWAETYAAALDIKLKRIDVAAPSRLLRTWRPEEAGVAQRLGVTYDVVMHWSRRLTPDLVLQEIEPTVRDKSEAIAACDVGVPVDWLAEQDTGERQVLRGHLRNGRYARAIGLTHHTGVDDDLLDMLLAYTPVLLWPHTTAGFPEARHGSLEHDWRDMPEALVRAYQCRWREEAVKDFVDLRAVWDDHEWLRFCRLFRTAILPAQTPDEGTS